MSERIDVHHHMLPPDYVRWLCDQGIGEAGGVGIPEWSAGATIEMMDRHGIRAGVLSVSAPGVHLGDATAASDWARRVNEAAAECVKDHPDRFGFFATLTLPDVDGSLAAARHAFDELSADGVILLASSRGVYLGSPDFDPLMAELDRRGAVVFVHPNELPGPAVKGIIPAAADFLLDTTRAAYNLVLHDVPGRYPGIRFILGHAGGFVPYASHRLALFIGATTQREPAAVLDSFPLLLLRHRAVVHAGHPADAAGVRQARSRAVRQRLALRARRRHRLLHRAPRRVRSPDAATASGRRPRQRRADPAQVQARVSSQISRYGRPRKAWREASG